MALPSNDKNGRPTSLLSEWGAFKNTRLPELVDNHRLNILFPVGHTIITSNPANPSSLGYPGRWQLEEEGCSVISTKVAGNIGGTVGDNSKSVPLRYHTHSLESVSIKVEGGGRRISQESETYLDYVTMRIQGGTPNTDVQVYYEAHSNSYGWYGFNNGVRVRLNGNGWFSGDIPGGWVRYRHRYERCDEENYCRWVGVRGWIKYSLRVVASTGQTFYSELHHRG